MKSDGALRLVAWETTRECNLSCVHCRAAAGKGPYEGELSTERGMALLSEIAKAARESAPKGGHPGGAPGGAGERPAGHPGASGHPGAKPGGPEGFRPIVILTGGEPLLRPDIFDLARAGRALGLRMVMAPNGTLLTPETAKRLVESGIERISISLDGAGPEIHDRFRGVPGAFEAALSGIRNARDAGLPFQINTTVTRQTLADVEAVEDLAVSLGAEAHHVFLLVPTGRGKYIAGEGMDAAQYEKTLSWFCERRDKVPLQLKATCAPHYYRIIRQKAKAEGKTVTFASHGLDAVTRGCLGGTGFCFVSHVGIVQPCGFLDIPCGDVTKEPFDLIWRDSEVFRNLRDYDNLKGKCGRCQYRAVCGGCRARAYEKSGDYLAEEPLCAYSPA